MQRYTYLIDSLLDFRNSSNAADVNELDSGAHNGKYLYNEPSLERIRRNSKLAVREGGEESGRGGG